MFFIAVMKFKWCENSSDLVSAHQDEINVRWELIFFRLTGVAELPSVSLNIKM